MPVDELTEMLRAWREDIDSVPFPNITAASLPRRKETRAR